MTMDSKTDLPMAIYRRIYCTIALFKFNQCDKFSSLTHSYRVGYFLITNDSRPIQTDSENSIGSKNFNGSDKLWKNLLFCLKDAFVSTQLDNRTQLYPIPNISIWKVKKYRKKEAKEAKINPFFDQIVNKDTTRFMNLLVKFMLFVKKRLENGHPK